MIVVDASATISALLRGGSARRALANQQLHVPHLVDCEVASVLRRRLAAGQVPANAAWTALRVWQRLGITRYPMLGLLQRMWELRDNVSAHDACYVALAESLDCPLLTADTRLAGTPGLRCTITVLPR